MNDQENLQTIFVFPCLAFDFNLIDWLGRLEFVIDFRSHVTACMSVHLYIKGFVWWPYVKLSGKKTIDTFTSLKRLITQFTCAVISHLWGTVDRDATLVHIKMVVGSVDFARLIEGSVWKGQCLMSGSLCRLYVWAKSDRAYELGEDNVWVGNVEQEYSRPSKLTEHEDNLCPKHIVRQSKSKNRLL